MIMSIPKAGHIHHGSLFILVAHKNTASFMYHKGSMGSMSFDPMEMSSYFLGFQKNPVRAMGNRSAYGVRKGGGAWREAGIWLSN